MKITINIDEKTSKEFKKDKFYDFFETVLDDIEYNIEDGNEFYNHDKEIAEALRKAFREAEVE